MGFIFNPADTQTIGVGIAAFLSTVFLVFVFLSARNEKLGRPMLFILMACTLWAWFGFLYQILPSIFWAREMRVISVIGIVWISVTEFHFASVYLNERMPLGRLTTFARWSIIFVGTVLTGLLIDDLLGTHWVVGALTLSQSVVLAPQAGPIMGVLIAFYILVTAVSGILLARRARAGIDERDKSQAEILFACITVGLALGGTRFVPWYGFDFYPFIGDIGFPMFVFGALYSIQRYRLFNVQAAAAQTLVFILWTFTFFRILLDPTLAAATPDIFIFVAVLVIGVFLLRSVVVEIRTQKELARLTVDKAKSEFVTVAAHQLRTPLSAVRWSLDLLRTDKRLTDDTRDIVAKGSEAASNMMYIVNDLLNAARQSEGRLNLDIEQGDLRDVGQVAVNVFGEAAKQKKISLSLELPPSPVPARFDRGKMAMVAENLLDNSIKYTPEGGKVTVAVSVQKDSARICVTDNGIGITPDEATHLFERFFRSDRAKRMFTDGSGLGLYIAKAIVEGHGGHFTLAPQESGGAVATVDIPLAVS